MNNSLEVKELFNRYVVPGNHNKSDYFALIKKLVTKKKLEGMQWQQALDDAYQLLYREIIENSDRPTTAIEFGTSGWRGKLGKDIFVHSVALVTSAIADMYEYLDSESDLAQLLGVKSFAEAQHRGCVLGFDNRFAGATLAASVAHVLAKRGFRVHYAGESTTGVLSAAVLQLGAAFSINLTPSHNPLEYGGYKFNAADAGPASSGITEKITTNAHRLLLRGYKDEKLFLSIDEVCNAYSIVQPFDSLQTWKSMVILNQSKHGVDLADVILRLKKHESIILAIDCIHGASRLHVQDLFPGVTNDKLQILRNEPDVTFGGVAPEPSASNMQMVMQTLEKSSAAFKIGAIIDPDGDRIRFTDGINEITMNKFGAMAYHFLHEVKKKKGLVAKTVATSNLANAIAEKLGEEIFEPSVGFKNFKPVIGNALVYFEESDGISIIGHTPEKDAYIGLILAIDMVLSTGKNLGEYLTAIEKEFGAYYPEKDGVTVSVRGSELLNLLKGLSKYQAGSFLTVGSTERQIVEVITIDGHKMVFDDGSWIMIRPSGTEPKVRFYVESRESSGVKDLLESAKKILIEVGVF